MGETMTDLEPLPVAEQPARRRALLRGLFAGPLGRRAGT
jgi:hypothetical protein